MADNVTLNSGAGGAVVATDDVGTVHFQKVKLDGGGDGVTTPIVAGGGVEASALRVTVASDSTGLLSVDDNAGSLTVDAPAGTPVAVRQSDGSAAQTFSELDLDTGVGTVNRIAVGIAAAASGGPVAIPGDVANGLDVDVTRLPALAAGTNNIGDVDVLTLPALPTGTNNIGDVDVLSVVPGTGATALGKAEDDPHATGDTGVMALAVRRDTAAVGSGLDGDYSTLNVNSVGRLYTSATVDAALPAGANNIGDVDVLSLPALPAGSNNIGDVDVLSMPTGASAAEVQGRLAHDGPIAGNPVLVGGMTETPADSAPTNRVSAEGDLARFALDPDGSQYVLPHGPQIWSYHLNTSTAQTDASVHAAPGAGLSLYVTDIVISLGAATALNVFFEETTTTVLGPYYLEAVNGRGLAIQFRTPKKITANTALTITTSASVAHAVDVTGYIGLG